MLYDKLNENKESIMKAMSENVYITYMLIVNGVLEIDSINKKNM